RFAQGVAHRIVPARQHGSLRIVCSRLFPDRTDGTVQRERFRREQRLLCSRLIAPRRQTGLMTRAGERVGRLPERCRAVAPRTWILSVTGRPVLTRWAVLPVARILLLGRIAGLAREVAGLHIRGPGVV